MRERERKKERIKGGREGKKKIGKKTIFFISGVEGNSRGRKVRKKK